ncbi:hypothetical protein NECAME_19181, partial [Necator americanus]
VFSASQHGGVAVPPSRPPINYFILPTFILHVVGLACLWALWYYLRVNTHANAHAQQRNGNAANSSALSRGIEEVFEDGGGGRIAECHDFTSTSLPFRFFAKLAGELPYCVNFY